MSTLVTFDLFLTALRSLDVFLSLRVLFKRFKIFIRICGFQGTSGLIGKFLMLQKLAFVSICVFSVISRSCTRSDEPSGSCVAGFVLRILCCGTFWAHPFFKGSGSHLPSHTVASAVLSAA